MKLKGMDSLTTVKFDEKANAAVRANNEDIKAKAEAEPVPGGNLDKLRSMEPNLQANGAEASMFNYEGDSAEELVAILLF